MEDTAVESTVGSTGPNASTYALFVAAEAVNNEGSKLYRQGSFEAAATSYSEALARLGKSVCYRDENASDECSRRRSKYYANRGRARVQLQDFEMAALDYRASIEEDPRNAKAFIWWARCEEALGRWDGALKHYEAASRLLQPGTSLLRTALEGGRRARTNREADRKVAREEHLPEELVHRRQMLRLSFREPVPAECRLGEWFSLSLGLSNEFGLWRRSDFGRSKTPAATIAKDQVAGCGGVGRGGGAEARLTPSMPKGLPQEVGEVAVACRGRETQDKREAAAASGRLRLVVEACDLEGFGGRSLASRCSRGSWTEVAEAPGRSTAPLGASPRPKGEITASCGGHAARLSPGFDESYCVTVETDGRVGGDGKGSAIGPEGKTTLRARFVLAAAAGSCVDRPNGSGDGGNSPPVLDLGVSPPAQNRPHFVLLRVSAVGDDAMLLLGRWVVPVLSLPIVLIEARGHGQDPNTTVASAPAPDAPENWRVRSAEQELRALSAKASEAGAVGCREAVIPVARVPVYSSRSSRRRRQRPDWSCSNAAAPATSAASDGTFDKGDSFRHGTIPPLWNRARRSVLDHASGGADDILDRDRNGDRDDGGGGVGPDEAVLLVAESPGQLGIGGKVWDSAFVLCDYLAQAAKYSAPGAAAIALADGDHALSKGAGTPVDRKNGGMAPHLQASVVTRSPETTLPAGAGGNSIDGSAGRLAANGEPLRRHETRGDESMVLSNVVPTSCGGGLVKGKRVLELGAGTGLVSICCALLGASAVVATDFEGVTELIKVNVELNFSKTSSQSSAPAEDDQPIAATELVNTPASESSLHGRQGQPTESSSSATAATLGMMAVKEKLSGLVDCASRSGTSESNDRNGGERCGRDLTPPSKRGEELLQRNQAPVIAVPLVWGERSAEVTSFDPEVVVMSDVIYDPAGYEPLLQTLLDIMRPGMIAIMAHRHRHPEDHIFFERLHNLFSVVEEKEILRRDKARCSSEQTPSPSRTQTDEPLEGVDVRVFRIYCPAPL